MRAGLSELLQIRSTQLQFMRGEKGKPLLTSTDSLGVDGRVGFNVSHQASSATI